MQLQTSYSVDKRDVASKLLSDAIAARSAKYAVIGLGYIGASMLRNFSDSGFDSYGYDRNNTAVQHFSDTKLHTDRFDVGTNSDIVNDADIISIAVRALPTESADYDCEPVKTALELAMQSDRARLILIHSTLPVGKTREIYTLIADSGHTCKQFFVAHCPERLQTDNKKWGLHNITHLVGGLDQQSSELANEFLSTKCKSVMCVSSPEVSEFSKLLENTFMNTGIALMAEITKAAHRMGLSANEIAGAAASKPFGYYPFYPGAGIGGHCLPNDIKILRNSISQTGMETTLLDAVTTVTEQLPLSITDYLESRLDDSDLVLKNQEVLLVGLGFKIGSHDTSATPASSIIHHLRTRGAHPVFLDSEITSFAVNGENVMRADIQELKNGRSFLAGIILSGDSTLESGLLESCVRVLIDAGGGRTLQGSPDKAIAL